MSDTARIGGGVRCQNPKCRAKLAGLLNGELRIKCRNCGLEQTIIIRMKPAADVPAVRPSQQVA